MKVSILICFPCLFILCGWTNPIKEQVVKLQQEWDFVLPLPSKNDSINLLFIQAEKDWYQFKYKEADKLFSKMLQIDSTFYQAIAFKAWVPLNLRYLNQALHYASKDTTIHRTIFEADYAFWINHDTLTAIKKFKEAYEKYPNSKTTCWCLGMSYLWAEQYDKAIEYYQKSLLIDNQLPKAFEMLGWAYFKKNEYKKAIENFEKSFAYGNEDLEEYRLTGEAYKKLGNHEQAKKYFQKAGK